MWDFDALASYSLSDIQAGVRKMVCACNLEIG